MVSAQGLVTKRIERVGGRQGCIPPDFLTVADLPGWVCVSVCVCVHV